MSAQCLVLRAPGVEAGGHTGGGVAVTVKVVVMPVCVGVKTSTLGQSPLTPNLALALPNCGNMVRGGSYCILLGCPLKGRV